MPEGQQGVTIKLHGLDTTKKHGLTDNTLLLGELFVHLKEVRGELGKADLVGTTRDFPAPSGERGRQPGRSAPKGIGSCTFSVHVNDALHWLAADLAAVEESKEFKGKQLGLEGQWKDGKRVEM